MSIAGDDFRDVLGRFATGVAVVTTVTADDRPHAMTATSFCAVSLDPPLVLFCLGRDADSFQAFESSGYYAVNILGHDHAHMSDRFAAVGNEKWRDLEYRHGEIARCPILPEALAVLECRKFAVHEAGDHLIMVGEVQNLSVHPADGDPLIHHRGTYRRLEPDHD